jgi:hypothetical protein
MISKRMMDGEKKESAPPRQTLWTVKLLVQKARIISNGLYTRSRQNATRTTFGLQNK